MPVAVLVHLRHFYRDHHHHHHHHHHHYCSLYLCNDQKIWITTKIHIFTKGFKHIECGRFLRDHAGFHEHNEPRVVLYKLWHDLINSHKVTKHACTFSCLPLATQCTTYTMTLQLWTNNKTNKSYKQLIYIYINISCKCDTNRAGHLTLDAYASRPVACSVQRWHLTSIGNPIVEIRRSYDRLISTMGFSTLIRHFCIESGPRLLVPTMAVWWHAPFITNVSSSRGSLGLLGSFIKFSLATGPNLLAPYQWVSARKT